MANPEHLKILEQGVETWNEWRKENPNIKPDLSKIHTSLPLPKINFSGTNLSYAKFDLNVFVEADFSNTNLYKARFLANYLHRTNFHSANLHNAELNNSTMRGSNMTKADLENADLRFCDFVQADLTGAILTGARLYGTSRDDWIIDNVECKYIYWDLEGKRRSPKNRDLELGEFEQLYAALPTFEYIFENGMTPLDPLIMDRVVQAIREKKQEFDIKIDSINARGLAPSIRFTVQHEEYKEPALEAVHKEYEAKFSRLESDRDRLYDLLGRAIDKVGDIKLITAGTGAIVATDGSTVNIQQHIHNALELQKIIADESEESESFAKVAKKTALDIVGGAIKDIAKGQVKEAVKQIIELGKDLGPVIAKTAAYAFFRSISP